MGGEASPKEGGLDVFPRGSWESVRDYVQREKNTAFDNFVTFLSTGQAYYNLHTSLNTPNTGAGNPGGSLGNFFTAVPEIDPTSFGSVLALLTGSLGLLERRMRRLRLTTTG